MWETVAQCLPTRASAVDALHAALKRGESDRTRVMGDVLLTLVRNMTDIAHISEGEVERLMEQEALELNCSMLANCRCDPDTHLCPRLVYLPSPHINADKMCYHPQLKRKFKSTAGPVRLL